MLRTPEIGTFALTDQIAAKRERAVRLKKTGNLVDAALARIEAGVAYDAARVRGLGVLGAPRVEPMRPGDPVAKLGRTTGLTRGVVSAIEVDRVIVGYDKGELRFDDQIELSPAGRTPFSRECSTMRSCSAAE